jgi:hypothetical protein
MLAETIWLAAQIPAAARSFKDFPDSSFHAALPFAEPNTQKEAAADGLLKEISFERTKSEPM